MLSEMKINDYIDLLASDAPAPGGGSASALCGAQGAGLCAMVAALTLGKKKYEEHQELCRDVYEQARMLSERMCALIDEDTEAFNRVSAAFKLPKDTDEDKAARKTAIAEATLGATMVPLDTLHRAHDGLELAKMLIGKSNTNCASDIGVAALNLVSCARGAWLNILINLGGIADAEKAQEIRAKQCRQGRRYICGHIETNGGITNEGASRRRSGKRDMHRCNAADSRAYRARHSAVPWRCAHRLRRGGRGIRARHKEAF